MVSSMSEMLVVVCRHKHEGGEGLLQVLQFGEFVQNRGKCIQGQLIGRQNSEHGHKTLSNRTLFKLWAIFCWIFQTLTDPT